MIEDNMTYQYNPSITLLHAACIGEEKCHEA